MNPTVQRPWRPMQAKGSSVNGRTLLAFLIGCAAPIPFRVVGLLYGAEVLMLLLAVWVVFTRMGKKLYSPMASRFIVFLVLGLAGYMITDLVRGTPSEDYVRGWSKIVFILTNFIALYFLSKNNNSALLTFFLGSGISGLVYYLVTPAHYPDFESQYKFEISAPLTFCCMCFLAMNKKLTVRLSPYVLALLGMLHIILDYRSLALMCFLTSAMLFAARRQRGQFFINKRILLVTFIGCGIALGALYVYSSDKYGSRRHESNSWRLGVTIATIKGIARAPIIGNGSWSSDEQMEAWRDEAIGVSHLWKGIQTFTTHSQVLEGWYEGGILSALFFFYYGYQLAAVFLLLFRRPVDGLTGVFLFVLFFAIWGYFCSPLNGPARLDLAGTMAILCYLRSETKNVFINRPRAAAYRTRYGAMPLVNASPYMGR